MKLVSLDGLKKYHTKVKELLNGKANANHNHNDIYYTESEINTKLNAKANSSHTHTISQITDFPDISSSDEEGKWTPKVEHDYSGSGGTVNANGNYWKIGTRVFITACVYVSGSISSVTIKYLRGFPFDTYQNCIGWTFYGQIYRYDSILTNRLELYSGMPIPNITLDSDRRFFFSLAGWYVTRN